MHVFVLHFLINIINFLVLGYIPYSVKTPLVRVGKPVAVSFSEGGIALITNTKVSLPFSHHSYKTD